MSVHELPVLQADEAVACCAPLAAVELSEPDAKTLAEQFAALADPVRLRLVSLLATAPDGAICVCDLVEPIGKSQPTISHHTRVLAEAGLIEGEKRGRWTWWHLVPEQVERLRGLLGGN